MSSSTLVLPMPSTKLWIWGTWIGPPLASAAAAGWAASDSATTTGVEGDTDDFRPEFRQGSRFREGRCFRYYDSDGYPEIPRCQREPLAEVTGTGGQDSPTQEGRVQRSDDIRRGPYLERPQRLEVLQLQIDVGARYLDIQLQQRGSYGACLDVGTRRRYVFQCRQSQLGVGHGPDVAALEIYNLPDSALARFL